MDVNLARLVRCPGDFREKIDRSQTRVKIESLSKEENYANPCKVTGWKLYPRQANTSK